MTTAASDLRHARRVCFFAHYDRFGDVADHVLLYLDALAEAGFSVVVLSSATLDEAVQARLRGHCHTLVMRANAGLDFGGWSEAVRRFLPLEAEFLLLANDSVYAPITSLTAFVDRLTAVPADVYGAIESREHAPHLQSWFLLLRPAVYNSATFRDFMSAPVDLSLDKDAIVLAREVGLTRVLDAAGFVRHAAYDLGQAGPIVRHRPINPSHLIWRYLVVQQKMPFIKVDLLRFDPVRVGSATHWRAVVEPRNPVLAEAIAKDLRRFSPARAGNVWERLVWSVDRYPTYWPEMQSFIARDHAFTRRPIAAAVNTAGYFLIETAGKVVRKSVRGLRRRAP
ncbi:rhamnan synthesis F family protein [Sphingomonas sp. PP-CC-3A-396]|uniref:rhamnan synthesis F family protein n=1 Tax=Sphingomonas sp. PP-CC-3A-396 TaxID=2135655 RepID=UPI0010EA73B4|nr:rhamnan synthesis F family protein [Sphingomonas sp. PP-CC-3A-396]TCQ02850.1 rhamnan synthesis protein F [Sphingomonas sp. PP-CC-3A-396]